MDTGQKQAKGRGIAKPEIFARINFLYQVGSVQKIGDNVLCSVNCVI